MKTKQGLRLRRIGSRHLIVRLSGTDADLSEVFTLNATAASLWKMLEAGDATVESLVERLADDYSVDPLAIRDDVQAQLDQWEEFGLIER